MRTLFIDSGYIIALAVPKDQHHAKAVEQANDLAKMPCRFVTTSVVLVEVGDSLSKPMFRGHAANIILSLEENEEIEIVPLTPELYRKAFALYRMRIDKAWGMTDCISFVVMQERSISEALSGDEHFEQAGFTALLR